MNNMPSDISVPNAKVLFRNVRGQYENRLVGRYNGMNVYPDNDCSDDFSGAGVYICDLILNPQSKGNYFAVFIREANEGECEELIDADIPHKKTGAKSGHFIDDSDEGAISRISECELFSTIFGDGNYRVCISPNGKNARIWPDKYGQITSANHVMTIGGLASIVPFESAGRVDFTKSKGKIDLRFREGGTWRARPLP